MISLNGCNWLFFVWLDSHVPVKTCTDGVFTHCISVAVATLAITLKARCGHELELLNTNSECAISGYHRSVDEICALLGSYTA